MEGVMNQILKMSKPTFHLVLGEDQEGGRWQDPNRKWIYGLEFGDWELGSQYWRRMEIEKKRDGLKKGFWNSKL